MNRAPSSPTRLRAGLSGLLLALVALTMQLAAASVVPFAAPPASVDELAAASICHGGGGLDRSGTPVRHQLPDCAFCPFCQAIAHATVLLGAPLLTVAAPALLVARAFVLPPSHAPPGGTASAASARGPPAKL